MAKTHKAAGAQMRQAAQRDASHATFDSFQNFLTRTGIGANNALSGAAYGFNPKTRLRWQLEMMYRGSWLVGQVVDCIAEDMTRAGIEVKSDMDPSDIDVLYQAMGRYDVFQRLCDTIKWSRLYGGALMVLLIDGQRPETPLRLDTLSKGQFRGLMPLDRWMVNPSLNDLVTELGPQLGQPKFYEIVADAPALPRMRIHYSRCIRIDGVDLPYYQKIAENLWGMSVIERLFDRMVAFDSATAGAAQLTYRAHLRTYAVEGLRDVIAAGGKALDGLVKQVDMMRAYQSNEGLTLIDTKDKFEAYTYTFAGLSDVLVQFGQQLSGASGIPLVRLFGQSPAGLNSTGESDIRNYYDNVRQQQERRLRHGVHLLLEVLLRTELEQETPEGFSFTFRPLWQISDTEKATIAATVTTAVTNAEASGIVSRATALKELRQSSQVTGIWSNITDEDIDEAEEEPPMPGEDEQIGTDEPGDQAEGEGLEEAGTRVADARRHIRVA